MEAPSRCPGDYESVSGQLGLSRCPGPPAGQRGRRGSQGPPWGEGPPSHQIPTACPQLGHTLPCPQLSGQVPSAGVGFCESGLHGQVPPPLQESVSLQGRTHEATARCPVLTSLHFPQPPRSRPEGGNSPGPRSPRDPEDRSPHPATAAGLSRDPASRPAPHPPRRAPLTPPPHTGSEGHSPAARPVQGAGARLGPGCIQRCWEGREGVFSWPLELLYLHPPGR